MLAALLFAGHNAAMECTRPLGCGGGLSFLGPLDIRGNRLIRCHLTEMEAGA